MDVLHYMLFLLSCIITCFGLIILFFTHQGIRRWSLGVRFKFTYFFLKRGWFEGRIDMLFYGLSFLVFLLVLAVALSAQLVIVVQLAATLLPLVWVWMFVATIFVGLLVVVVPMWATGAAADKAIRRWVRESM